AGPIGQLSSVIGERLSEPRAGRASVGQSKGSSVHTQAQFSQTVSLPNAVVGTNLTNFTLPLTLSANTAPFISFDLHFTFNTAVVGFQATPVSAAGLTASGWSVAGNVVGNELRISGFATTATPVSGTGTLLNLNFTRLGAQGTSTALTWTLAAFDDFAAIAAAGNITIGGAPSAATLSSFTATGYDSGVHLSWQTALETGNLGFNIFRETAGKLTLINSEIIGGSALL